MLGGNLVQMTHYDHYLVVDEMPVSERGKSTGSWQNLCYCFESSPWLYCEANSIWSFTGMLQAQWV